MDDEPARKIVKPQSLGKTETYTLGRGRLYFGDRALGDVVEHKPALIRPVGRVYYDHIVPRFRLVEDSMAKFSLALSVDAKPMRAGLLRVRNAVWRFHKRQVRIVKGKRAYRRWRGKMKAARRRLTT